MVQTNGILLSIGAAATCGLAYMLMFGTGDRPESPAFVSEITRQIAAAAPGTVRVAPEGWRDYARHAPDTQALPEVVRTMRTTSARTIPAAAPVVPLPTDRAGITRELQRQLTRVGCYEGEISGTWTPGTRRAMQAFTDHVNAALPTSEPDQILLALVKGHPGAACGACPSGQSAGSDGRCLPNAILARAPEKARGSIASAGDGAIITGWSATTSVTATIQPPQPHAAPLEGRMALAGPGTGDPADNGDDARPAPSSAAPVPRPEPVQAQPPRRSSPGKFGTSIFRALDRSGT